ncbi:pentatricopeptide repeat-containing protein At3g49740-like [Wolffia australiana]
MFIRASPSPAALLIKLNSSISNLSRHCRSREALKLFTQIQSHHSLSPDEYSLVGALTASANLRAIAPTAQLHSFAARSGLLSFLHVSNSLLAAYSSAGDPAKAHRLFSEISSPDVYSHTTILSAYADSEELQLAIQLFERIPQKEAPLWNALITGSMKNGHGDKAVRLYQRMRQDGSSGDQYATASILSLCDSPPMSDLGMQIHAAGMKAGLDVGRPSVMNSLVSMYFNVGIIDDAVGLFSEASQLGIANEITYNAVISGLARSGRGEEAIAVFKLMLSGSCFRPTELTLVSVLSGCSSSSSGRQFHCLSIKTGLVGCAIVGNAAVGMYSRAGELVSAETVFEGIKNTDLVSWNSLLSAYSQAGRHESGIKLYRAMEIAGLRSDEFTYGSLLGCSLSSDLVDAILSLLIRRGLTGSSYVSNSTIVAYGKHGEIEKAVAVFEGMPERNLISWNSLLSGCTMNGEPRLCLELFSSLMESDVRPNQYTFSIILSVCGSVGMLRAGEEIHAHLVKTRGDEETSVGNALIAVYAKAGEIELSSRVFHGMHDKDVVSWNSIIAAYAQNGQGELAVSLFKKMMELGVEPDSVTFTNVLSGCSHGGLVDEAQRALSAMIEDFGFEPGADHYACVIDLLARAGRMEEAESMISKLPREVDSRLWWALLSSCVTYGSLRLGRVAAEALLETEPGNPAVYVMLSNLNAGAGRWEEASAMRKKMKCSGALKQPGFSWVLGF